MEREKVNELYEKAFYATEDKTRTLYEFARLVELETLERATKVCSDAAECAITNEQESSFIYCAESIRSLKLPTN